MIYTVTLSPSIDYIVRMSNMRSNTTNRTDSEEFYFGGKGINVSQVLAELDLDSTAFGFIAGFTGEAIEKGLRNNRIRTDFIHLNEGFTRINIKIKAGGETEINGQGPDIPEAALQQLMQKLDHIKDGDTLVLAGSIPKTCPDDIYERMLERVKDKKIMIAVDATRKLLVNSLSMHPFLIKPNRLELSEIFHKEVETEDDVKKYAGKLQEMGARNVIVSLGRKGAFLLDETGATHSCGVLKQPVINTVGAGDSMVAGFIAGYLKTGDYGYALKLGSACGNATSFLPGLATRAKIDEVFAQLK
ncbi:1-phosphofructokinase [Ruminococcus sp.]|uniref:1-phosphofructokinase n=1 Tax=Ruminococcus sp. TaxID=41978 RepID=UPI002E80C710|nr:1-phosphofructokinase [Ruminococcus sp.]MEE3492395.1 1-phosphofructokinase [Ruminococcus sp.]